jgi:hypothetical protein
MIPNNIQIVEDGIKFRLTWSGPIQAHGYLVCVARDSEFILDRRCFFVPPVAADGVSFDMGSGTWFFRIGSLVGEVSGRGVIKWSNMYGPYINSAAGSKPPPPLGAPGGESLLHTRSIQGGVRAYIHYDRAAYIMIMESSRTSTLPASDTSWTYQFDTVRRGSVDILNLDPLYKYTIRCTLMDGATFPTDRIVALSGGIRCSGTSEKPVRHFDSGGQSIHRADVAILRQTENERNITFSSHADYLRYQAARARAGIDAIKIPRSGSSS